MRNKNIILDTNLWISFLITDKLNEIDELILEGRITLVFSNELIEEFLTVSKRPKFKKHFSEHTIKELLSLFDNYGKLVKVSTEINSCRDFKDNFLLNLAIDSKSDYLITGDSDLLILKKIKKTKILKWVDFLKEIK